jgi:hypothetical protein
MEEKLKETEEENLSEKDHIDVDVEKILDKDDNE